MPTPDEIAEAMRLLGFDPEQTKTVVISTDSAVAVSVDYPEPIVQPEEPSHAE